jgi:hypothetical protein
VTTEVGESAVKKLLDLTLPSHVVDELLSNYGKKVYKVNIIFSLNWNILPLQTGRFGITTLHISTFHKLSGNLV